MMKTTITLLVLLCGSFAHAQDPMAKWKPSVGDKFVYVYERYNGYGFMSDISTNITWTDSLKDTVMETITSISDPRDSLCPSAVRCDDTIYTYREFYDPYRLAFPQCFQVTDSKSEHPFTIDSFDFSSPEGDTTVWLENTKWNAFSARTWSEYRISDYYYLMDTVLYSPNIH